FPTRRSSDLDGTFIWLFYRPSLTIPQGSKLILFFSFLFPFNLLRHLYRDLLEIHSEINRKTLKSSSCFKLIEVQLEVPRTLTGHSAERACFTGSCTDTAIRQAHCHC